MTTEITTPTPTDPADERETFDSLSPVNGDVVGTHPVHTAEDVQAAVSRAHEAAAWWSSLSFDERAERLTIWKGVITRRIAQLADLVHHETGKPHSDADPRGRARARPHRLGRQARQEGARPAEGLLRAGDGQPGSDRGVPARSASSASSARGTTRSSRRWARSPTPWRPATPWCSSPASSPPASAAGWPRRSPRSCPTTRSSRWSPGSARPARPCAGPGVDKLAFTGSTATGKKVMAACAETLTPVVIEAGGKDAVLVDEDADLDAAADAALWGACSNAGQTCIGVERVYVHDRVYDEFLSRLVDKARDLRADDSPDAKIGPITMPSQLGRDPLAHRRRDRPRRPGRARWSGRGRGPLRPADDPGRRTRGLQRRAGGDLRPDRDRQQGRRTWTRRSARANGTRYGLGLDGVRARRAGWRSPSGSVRA